MAVGASSIWAIDGVPSSGSGRSVPAFANICPSPPPGRDVDPDSRRRGIGAVMLREAISEAKSTGANVVTLEVRRSNLPARQLYRKFEFEERRLRRHYYGPGEDAIIMELRFD